MRMHNPPHPGELIRELWLQGLGISVTDAAAALGIARKTLSKIVNGRGAVTAEMALRLEKAFGPSAESWLGHQAAWDLFQAERSGVVRGVRRLAA